MKKRIAVLISNKGTGSNLAAIIDAVKIGEIPNAQIIVVVSNKADAQGLMHANKNKIPTEILDLSSYKTIHKSREDYNRDLARILIKKYDPDLIVLAGWMIILSETFIQNFTNKIINLHPGLLPDGKDSYVYLSNGAKIKAIRGLHTDMAVKYALDHHYPASGSTVHFITAKVDEGPVIIRGEVPILPKDTVATLYSRMKIKEHEILPLAVKLFCEGKLHIKKGKIEIS